jgi:hypothetical protein
MGRRSGYGLSKDKKMKTLGPLHRCFFDGRFFFGFRSVHPDV